MDIAELHHTLQRLDIPLDAYYLNGDYGAKSDNEVLSLALTGIGGIRDFTIYYKERGTIQWSQVWATEAEACEEFLHEMQAERTRKIVGKVSGLTGMTVNERLVVTGLDAEFQTAKRNNKRRARQILQILGIDIEHINALVK